MAIVFEIVCADGLRLDVHQVYSPLIQSGDFRQQCVFELIGPPGADELLSPFENPCNATGDGRIIYPYVGADVVEAVIERHGGAGPMPDWVEATPEMVAAGIESIEPFALTDAAGIRELTNPESVVES